MQTPADDESPTLRCHPHLPTRLVITNIFLLWSFINVESSRRQLQRLFALSLMQVSLCYLLFFLQKRSHLWFSLIHLICAQISHFTLSTHPLQRRTHSHTKKGSVARGYQLKKEHYHQRTSKVLGCTNVYVDYKSACKQKVSHSKKETSGGWVGWGGVGG